MGSKVDVGQIRRHLNTARRRGFEDIHALVISITPPRAELPSGTSLVYWKDVYKWLRQHSEHSEWAHRTSAYFEIAEEKMVEAKRLTEGTLTDFAGFTRH